MKYLTAKEASKILGISTRRVRKKIGQKRRICFPGAKKVGHQWMIPEKEVEKERLKYLLKIKKTIE